MNDLEIYKSEIKRFNDTRKLQWKFNILIWTLLALAIQFLSTHNHLFHNSCHLLILLTGCFLFHLIYVCLIQDSLHSSKNEWNNMRVLMGIPFGDHKTEIKDKDSKWHRRDYFWVFWQIGITAILLAVLWHLR